MTVKAIEIQPTFPLDDAHIRQLRRSIILQTPRLMGLQFLGVLGQLLQGTQLGPLAAWGQRAVTWWEDEERQLTLRVVRQLIDQSNQRQDATIRGMVDQLGREGHPQFAIALGKFLLLKQHIERELHQGGPLNSRKEKIEQLVDSICQEVCHEVHRLSMLESQVAEVLTSRDQQKLARLSELTHSGQARVMHAYSTLAQTADQLAILLVPGKNASLSNDENGALDRLLEILRAENSLTQVIDERLRTELPQAE